MNAIALNGGVALLTGAAAAWPGDRQALRALGRCSRDLGAADERVDVSHVPALRTGSHGRLDSLNCAGITAPTTLIEQCSLTKWRRHSKTWTIRPDRGGRGPRSLASQKGVRSRPPAVSTCPAAAQPTDDALATVSRRRHLPPEVPSVSVERTRENLSLMCEFDAQRTLSPLRAFDTHQSKKQLTQTNQLVDSVCEAEKVAGGLFSVEAASNPHSRT